MSHPDGRSERDEPVTFTDRRRIDPQTGEVREGASGPAPSGPGPGAAPRTEDADKVAELTADLQRVQADFANYRKRALRDQEVAGERAKAVVVSQLLPVLDDLDRARSHGDLESGPLKSVADKLVAALTGLGVAAFGVAGEDFDPSLHEAVQHEGEGARPVIGHVMRQGYRLADQVLRHALVGVVDTVAGPDTHPGEGQSGSDTAESDQ
ncbi:MAG: nucleotide exchange factor GrpE [Actinomycetia bacterium]|nr:nucleotide exchange factor GrpE [Actinomycetes bacterium]